ncbi:MAG: hypothetical protein ACXADL_08465 [Candidatus Thorarchaeota archaeon]
MLDISPTIRQNRALYGAAVIQLIYGLIELIDSVTIVLIAARLIPNLYLPFVTGNPDIYAMFENLPILFIPIFWFFTSLRLISAYWIFKNKAKGFWMALFVSGVTLVAVFFLLPFSVIDIIATFPVVILLFQGYFRDEPILSE